ncbi:hypothetical protein UCREL1_83 [Eutypa lata UCREL1]|uniref:Uncharacterized protein n=1 Tax=Eutypa lata (strain UCR-EL1) TaxID=1287681 RepID=M7T1P4_EUTLA|nr:hypothetical protein UCREL1_83 [Eutypa lata UCREL1]
MEDAVRANEARTNSLLQLRASLNSSLPIPDVCDLEFLYEERRLLELISQSIRSSLHCGGVFGIATEIAPTLNALSTRAGNIQQMIEIVSRRSLRPLNIMDMPDEILMIIFGHAEGWIEAADDPWDRRKGVDDIRNIRLTSRRFHNCSSHLLLYNVCVELTEESLSRFEEISRHPLISNGIRGVHVALDFYDSVLASDRRKLGFHIYERLIRIVRAHDRYRQCYESQERLRLSGKFPEALAAAMSRLSRIERMEFLDGRGQPSLGLLVKIPAAVGGAGVKLEQIRFRLALPEDTSEMFPNVQESQNIRALVTKLQRFHARFAYFPHQRIIRTTQTPRMAAGILHFITTFLDTDSLKGIGLDFASLWGTRIGAEAFNLGLLIQERSWPNLENFLAIGVSLRMAALKAFVHLRQRPTAFRLEQVRLSSGTWAEVLDILRTKSSQRSNLMRPSGAEINDMTRDELAWIVGTKSMDLHEGELKTQAALYVCGQKSVNPFREGPPPEDVEMLDVE